ncbi:uncharacterized protein RAG0_00838 [Rhynchosporium agropyri]|uniref:Uncharacterized protein n=1 Tax=Rhynchosporium agropyri TaxID=914238 RepID=A0A1E1JYS1_9HELO|nr:uncharacterized protein RAG0_00838 [Rhynchosporium agropyri]
MCYHKRTVYSCQHNGWGPQVRSCNLQKAFLDGTFSAECEMMSAHPMHSLKVHTTCQTCAKKQKKTSKTLSRLRSELMEMKEKMARVQKARGSSYGGSEVGEHAASAGIDDGEFERINASW